MDELLNKPFLLQHLMDHSSDAIYFKDRQSRFIKVNWACAKKHGCSEPAELVGKTDFDLYSGVHAQEAFDDEQRIMETGEGLYGFEEQETWPDGHITWVSSTKLPLKDQQGGLIGTFGMTRDITAIKQAELKARKYADEMRLIKEEIESDLEIAGRLQKTFFPDTYPVFPAGAASENSCVEFCHTRSLIGEVSGNYCSISAVSASELELFICDVRGRGLRAALGTGLIRAIVQELSPKRFAPGEYLSRMNARLTPLLNHDDLQLDVTACYMVLDLGSGLLRVANAAHPLPIHLPAGGAAKYVFENLAFCGPALAVDSEVSYPTVEVRVQPGDSLLLFTAGLFSVANSGGRVLGEKGLLDLVRGADHSSLSELVRLTEEGALSFASEHRFNDDVCLLGLNIRHLMGH